MKVTMVRSSNQSTTHRSPSSRYCQNRQLASIPTSSSCRYDIPVAILHHASYTDIPRRSPTGRYRPYLIVQVFVWPLGHYSRLTYTLSRSCPGSTRGIEGFTIPAELFWGYTVSERLPPDDQKYKDSGSESASTWSKRFEDR